MRSRRQAVSAPQRSRSTSQARWSACSRGRSSARRLRASRQACATLRSQAASATSAHSACSPGVFAALQAKLGRGVAPGARRARCTRAWPWRSSRRSVAVCTSQVASQGAVMRPSASGVQRGRCTEIGPVPSTRVSRPICAGVGAAARPGAGGRGKLAASSAGQVAGCRFHCGWLQRAPSTSHCSASAAITTSRPSNCGSSGRQVQRGWSAGSTATRTTSQVPYMPRRPLLLPMLLPLSAQTAPAAAAASSAAPAKARAAARRLTSAAPPSAAAAPRPRPCAARSPR